MLLRLLFVLSFACRFFYFLSVLESEVDPKNVRLTTQSEPKILMEVMPAALVVSLLVLTYLVFAGGVALIVRYVRILT